MNEIEKRAQFEAWLSNQLNCMADAVILQRKEDGAYVSKFAGALCEAFYGGITAGLSAAPQVPEGWVPVPENPSAEMRSSGDREIRCCEGAAAVWYAMLAARPEPQA